MKQKTKLYVGKYSWSLSDEFSVFNFDASKSDSGFILHDVIEVELEFDTLNEQQIKQLKIDGLKKQKAEFLQKAADIDDKIQSMMAIEVSYE